MKNLKFLRLDAALFACMTVLIAATAAGCLDKSEPEVPGGGLGIDPEAAREYFAGGVLNEGSAPPIELPPGYRIESIEEIHPSDWEEQHGALATFLWHLDGPEHGDTVVLTVYASVSGASKAWDDGKPHLASVFHVRDVTPLADLGYPARLFNGGVRGDEQAEQGFSDAVGLVKNISVRVSTLSYQTPYSANADGAIALMRAVVSDVIGTFNLGFD